MDKKYSTTYVAIIVLVVLVELLVWRIGFNSSGDLFSNTSLSETLTQELGEAEVYQEPENDIAFLYPKKLNVTEMPIEGIEGGKRILAESGEEKKGFEIIILPFDEPGPLTRERILADVPDIVMNNVKNISVSSFIPAISFDSMDENIGATFEIWFANNGKLYQARTYLEFGPAMEEILKKSQFK